MYRQRLPEPYSLNPKSSGNQSIRGSYDFPVKRRGSTPSPNRLNPGVSSCSLLSGDLYDNFNTNSLGRGQAQNSRNVHMDHLHDFVLHGSTSPLVKRYVLSGKHAVNVHKTRFLKHSVHNSNNSFYFQKQKKYFAS